MINSKLTAISGYLVVAILLFTPTVSAAPTRLNANDIIQALGQHYGPQAALRAKAWFNIINENSELTDKQKLESTNNFFNLFRFIDDSQLWGDSNYWASPMEFIGVGGGDCEDFSIAKYFTLLQLGISEEKLRITMVKATSVDQYHMVLAYYEKPNAIPLVLDNLDKQIKPATDRPDLLPAYSFNGTQLWLNKEKGKGELAGSSSRLEKWTDLKHRLGVKRLRQPKLNME
ncbi:hypothetical protein G3R48_09400 [Shewanella intestini]|uniref:Sulfate adenylyltransferase n=1 Tax=Shewanella intestini TaxID=2017544 RepID=A0ABS5I2E7_9GAMM|nr:hypothetical protein [Shewanella intestini]